MFMVLSRFQPFFQRGGLALQPIILLLLRFYVASIFLKSGVQKISHWDSTVFLFEYEYHVPLLPATWAAVLGTAAELILPVLLLLGLFTRLTAVILSIFNGIAVLSYPVLLKGSWGLVTAWGWLPIGLSFPSKGAEDHVVWGLMLLVIVAFSAGKLSVDHLFNKKMKPIFSDERINQ